MEESSNSLNVRNIIYCVDCGAQMSNKALSCPNCGCPTSVSNIHLKKNKWVITLLLCGFLGTFGIHRFYNGHTTIGVLQLITLGGCGIWTLIDVIIIISGNFKDSNGDSIRRL